MSQSLLYRQYMRALTEWPKDRLRPECQLQETLLASLDQTNKNASPPSIDKSQTNALYSLLEDRYSKKYPLTGSLLAPPATPTHYADLLRELHAAPQRSWWGRLVNRTGGMLRFS